MLDEMPYVTPPIIADFLSFSSLSFSERLSFSSVLSSATNAATVRILVMASVATESTSCTLFDPCIVFLIALILSTFERKMKGKIARITRVTCQLAENATIMPAVSVDANRSSCPSLSPYIPFISVVSVASRLVRCPLECLSLSNHPTFWRSRALNRRRRVRVVSFSPISKKEKRSKNSVIALEKARATNMSDQKLASCLSSSPVSW
mmetsp:Transcript_11466/g.30384  ORF Transcript_11466/g.30384 Transcript_11466/m.30384 type:complete len:207 (+) Transcript_11466:1116-1736(+)